MMRWKLHIALLASVLLIVAGVWTVVMARDVVRWPPLVQIGERLHWPGSTGSYYEPDYHAWERPVMFAGLMIGACGVAAGTIGFSRWLLVPPAAKLEPTDPGKT